MLHWQQISDKPKVNLTLSPDNKTATFKAPEVEQNTPLTFTLIATDDKGENATKDVTVTIEPQPVNLPPKVSAGSTKIYHLAISSSWLVL